MQHKRTAYKIIIILAVASILSFTETDAGAQRTAQGQIHFSGHVDYNLSTIGGEVSGGQYLYFGYWAASLNAQNYAYKFKSSNVNANFLRLTPSGIFMYRLLKTPSRNLNLYGGGDVFLGPEFLDLFAQLPETTLNVLVNKGFSRTRFIYGGSLRLEGEFFPLRKLAIILPLRLSFTGNTAKNEIVGFTVGLGIRYNL